MNPSDYTQFQDPCIKYPSDDHDLAFANYIAECRTLIQNTRTDLDQYPDPEKVIEANTPFELKPAHPIEAPLRYGALLIHGLLDCPFVMRDIANELQSQGLLVRSILLPGHGTTPAALLNVKYQDWLQATHYGIQSLSKEVDKIFLVGFSTGASLALYHSLQTTYDNIAALVLLAPAIQISPFSCFTNLPPKLRSLSKRFEWLHVTPENDYAKYQSMPFNAAYQVYLLTQQIKRVSDVKFLKHPVFVGITADDKTVSSKATIQYFREHSPKNSRMLVYTNKPNHLQDTRIVKRPASYPEMSIANISHVAIPAAPNNLHYGEQGDYARASHIEANLQAGKPIIYGTFNNFTNDMFNVLYRAGIYKHEYMRLTFNPDFDFLILSIKRFIENIISD
jgi:esterase/lipase